MKPRFFFWTVSLVAVLVVSACASSAVSTPTAPPQAAESIPATVTLVPTVPVATAAASVTVQAVATSRGPNLEATDPSTVKLASGQLQLVEFFRFT